ncbi:MAG: permease-like cell division protein FtsX [Bacillota bacterium]|nr:ABC transporter permease [Candidatus Fermentithermobacillaceae bacterium]
MRLIGYMFSQAFRSIWRNKLSSFLSALTTGFALFLLGTSFLVSINLGFMYQMAETQMEIQAYMNKEATYSELASAATQIREMPGVSEVKFVSKEDALEELREMFKDKASVLDSLEEDNPLPPSVRIKTVGAEEIPGVVEALKSIDVVDDVMYQEEVSKRLVQVGKAVQYLSLGGMLVVGLVSVMVIANSIRLAIDARRQEIGIMKLVGATDGFVLMPFLFEGIFLGFLGSALGTGFALGAYNWVAGKIAEFIPFMPIVGLDSRSIWDMFGIMALTGVMVGLTGSAFSVRRHLRV